MKYKFEIVLHGLQFAGRVFYRQTVDAGLKYAEEKIRELQRDFDGEFNKEVIVYVLEREDSGKFRWVDTKRFEPTKN